MLSLPISGHAGGQSFHMCIQHAIPMRVRVKEDATRLYAADTRWEHLGDIYRSWAIRIIDQIEQRECEVIESGSDERGVFYNIRLDPVVTAPNLVGIQREYPFVQIPAEYVTVVRSGFWRAS